MSKMSWLHAELSEQAHELGFESLDVALGMGYTVDYTEGRLVKHECCDVARELEAAHQAQLSERDKIVEELTTLRDDAADLAMGTGTHTDEWSKVALLADKVANYIKENIK